MLANTLPTDPHTSPSERVPRSKFIFFQTWSCCISNKRNHKMQQHGSKCFALRARQYPRGWGLKGQNSSFSEHGHIAYQIKANHKMQQHGSKHFAHIPPSTLRPWIMVYRSKSKFFRTCSCCISDLRESQNAATW